MVCRLLGREFGLDEGGGEDYESKNESYLA